MKTPSVSKISKLQSRKGNARLPERHFPLAEPKNSASNEPSEPLPIQSKKSRTPRGTIVFQIEANAADRVKLAADFTSWEKEPIDLRRVEDGTWKIAVELPRGQYSYRFLVDDEWHDDPRCPDYEPNPYGGLNAVVRVM